MAGRKIEQSEISSSSSKPSAKRGRDESGQRPVSIDGQQGEMGALRKAKPGVRNWLIGKLEIVRDILQKEPLKGSPTKETGMIFLASHPKEQEAEHEDIGLDDLDWWADALRFRLQ